MSGSRQNSVKALSGRGHRRNRLMSVGDSDRAFLRGFVLRLISSSLPFVARVGSASVQLGWATAHAVTIAKPLTHSPQEPQDKRGRASPPQCTRKARTVASSVWRPREKSSIVAKIAWTISSADCVSLSAAALRRLSTPHSSPAGFTASITPSE